MVKKFLLLPNELKDLDLSFTNKMAGHLLKKGQQVLVCDHLMGKMPAGVSCFNEKEDIDVAVVIGGDGTILRWAHRLRKKEVPILGINYGRLGYLAEVEPTAAKDALDQIIADSYKVEDRMVLKGVLEYDGGKEQTFYACNDLVIHRGEQSGMLPVRAYINGTFMDTFRCDGIIAATPSGSTAYNFSAGGPIVNPVAENILFTPICSHSALSRSIIATGNDIFRFEVDSGRQEDVPVLNIDGVEKVLLHGSCSLTVCRDKRKFRLIRVSEMSFYEILHKKMFV